MQVFLYQHIAAPGKCGVLVADHGEFDRLVTLRIFGAVDEARHAAQIEIAEAVHFIDDRHLALQLIHHLHAKFKTQDNWFSADVDRKSDVEGKSVAGRVDRGGRRIINNKTARIEE